MDNDQEVVRRLLEAVDQYSPYYDEVFWDALDMLTLASMLHRRLDDATVR